MAQPWRLRHGLVPAPHRAQPRHAALCFALAWGMHFIWNSPLLEDRFGNGPLGLSLLFAKGVPVLLATAVVWRAAGQVDGRRARS